MIRGPSANTAPQATTVWVCESQRSHVNDSIFKYAGFLFFQCPFVVDQLHLSKMSVAEKTYVALVWGRVSELVSSPCLPPSPRCWAVCVLSSEGGDKISGFYSIKAVLSQLCSEIMIHRSEAAICLQSNGGHFCFWGKMNRQQSWQWLWFKGQKVHTVGQYVGGLFTHTGDVYAVIPLSITDSKNNNKGYLSWLFGDCTFFLNDTQPNKLFHFPSFRLT